MEDHQSDWQATKIFWSTTLLFHIALLEGTTRLCIVSSCSEDLREQYLQGYGEAAAEWRQLTEPKQCGRSALDGLITRIVSGWPMGLLEGFGRKKAPAGTLRPLDPKGLQQPS